MSYISPFIENLRNEVPLYDDHFEEEIMSYPLYLDESKKESAKKDQKAKDFYKTFVVKNRYTNDIFSLDFDSLKESRASLMQNFTSSFARVLVDDRNLIMAFTTSTIPPEYRLQNCNDTYEDVLKYQHKLFSSSNKHIRKDKNNRDMKFFNTFELHKKGDLHQHTLAFLPDTLDSLTHYVKVVSRAKNAKDLGRVEIRLPYKYKKLLISNFNMIHYTKKGNNLYYIDHEQFLSGYGLIFSFFNPGKDSAKDIVSYMMKYTSKNTSYSKQKSNEYYVFRKLGIRAFTYSGGVLPSVTAYQKIRGALTAHNPKYGDMYELQQDINSGLVKFTTFYEKKEAEYYKFSRKSFGETSHPDYDCPILRHYISTKDILVQDESFRLVAVSVTFSDGSPAITWSTGTYERITMASSLKDEDYFLQNYNFVPFSDFDFVPCSPPSVSREIFLELSQSAITAYHRSLSMEFKERDIFINYQQSFDFE